VHYNGVLERRRLVAAYTLPLGTRKVHAGEGGLEDIHSAGPWA
jgi:hypothetical protein